MQLAYHGLRSYRDGNGRLCRCDLQVYRDGDVAVVVVSEREDNPGSSITNSYGYLATGVWQKLGLSFEQTTWIEHYGAASYEFAIDERLDWVTLERDANRLICPRWRPGSREELERLIGQAFTG
jgi:hypothetical protein